MSFGQVFTVLCAFCAAWMIWNGVQALVSGHVHSQRGRIERANHPRTFVAVTGLNLIGGPFLLWAAWFLVYGW